MSRGTLFLTFFTALSASIALSTHDLGHLPWALARASGLASFGALSLSVILGLLISTKASDGLLSRPFVFEMHQFLSVLSLSLIGVHMGSLVFDRYLSLSLVELLVPFASAEKPLEFGLGIVAAWLTVIATVSFWFRSRIGVKRWRKLHYVTFAAYGAGLAHGLAAGTDAQLPVVYWGYVASAAAVLALTVLRVIDAKPRKAATKRTSSQVARKAA